MIHNFKNYFNIISIFLIISQCLSSPRLALAAFSYYQDRNPLQRKIPLVEFLDLGKGRICAYVTEIPRFEVEALDMLERSQLPAKEAVRARWQHIRSADPSIFGPMDAYSLITDLGDLSRPKRKERRAGRIIAAVGLGLVFISMWAMSTHALHGDQIFDKVGVLGAIRKLAERMPQRFRNYWQGLVNGTPIKATNHLANASWREIVRSTTSADALLNGLMTKFVQKGDSVFLSGMATLGAGYFLMSAQTDAFTTHELRSIFSNHLYKTSHAYEFQGLEEVLHMTREDLNEQCPGVEEIWQALMADDFSHYSFKLPRFPSKKLNFERLIQTIKNALTL